MYTAWDVAAGKPAADRRQRDLVLLLGRLRAAIRSQVCRYTIENTLAFLEEHIELRFGEEERGMEQWGYEDYRHHRERHRQFASEVEFLSEELRNIKALGLKGSYELSVETIQLLSDWIGTHVLGDDERLCRFLRECCGHDLGLSPATHVPEDTIGGHTVTICSVCKRIRGGRGIWRKREHFRALPQAIRFSRGLCPECLQEYYSDLFQEKR